MFILITSTISCLFEASLLIAVRSRPMHNAPVTTGFIQALMIELYPVVYKLMFNRPVLIVHVLRYQALITNF